MWWLSPPFCLVVEGWGLRRGCAEWLRWPKAVGTPSPGVQMWGDGQQSSASASSSSCCTAKPGGFSALILGSCPRVDICPHGDSGAGCWLRGGAPCAPSSHGGCVKTQLCLPRWCPPWSSDLRHSRPDPGQVSSSESSLDVRLV